MERHIIVLSECRGWQLILAEQVANRKWLDDARKEILEWLVPANIDPMRNQESAVTLRQPGTGVWFTDGIEFQEWKLKRNSKLWLHGIRMYRINAFSSHRLTCVTMSSWCW